jgi:membrane-associated protease RseP (regulator of RpoE activity)
MRLTATEPTTDHENRSLALFLVGVAALAALLTWWGGWALPVVIGAIIVMVMGHEFGHFITAKRAGMMVTDFFVGFGPVIWSTTRGETRYGVRALLLGGYVKVPGMTWGDTLAPDEEKRTYRSASYPRKVLFASAGSLMHLVMALLLAWVSFTFIGTYSSSAVGVAGFTSWEGHARNAAQIAGLRVGDRIEDVNGHRVTSETELVGLVHHRAGETTSLTVLRNGKVLVLHATPVLGGSIKVRGESLTKNDAYIGVQLEELTVRTSWYGAVPAAVRQIGNTITAAVHAMVHVFSPGEFSSLFHQVASPAAANNTKNQLNRPESIVGVVRIAVQGAQSGATTLLEILMIVNIFVGVLNMLPMLPLDGGYVAVATYERLRSRRGRGTSYHANLNYLTPFIYMFMSVLLVLFASTLYLDIVHPIANPFQ